MTDTMSKAAEIEEFERTGVWHGFNIGDLGRAYERIVSKDDPRGPISAVIDSEDFELYEAAVFYFTATGICGRTPLDGGKVRICSIGYRAGPAGDH